MKFKIKTDEVKKASRQTKLKIEDSITLNLGEMCACPIGTLYFKAKKCKFDNLGNLWSWANKKFGQDYVSGFVGAFDGRELINDLTSKQYKLGHYNGKVLRKSLLK